MNKIKQNCILGIRNNVKINFLNELKIDKDNISAKNNCLSEN